MEWKPVETAPERPERKYLAVDCCGYYHLTDHPRHVLMHAGWAEAWCEVPEWKTPNPLREPARSAVDGGREIAASHAREFKRLLTAHRIPDEIIEGVRLA